MKHLQPFLIMLICCTGLNTFAQTLMENNVPKIVRDAFIAKYPNTIVHEWEFKGDKLIYEAEFIANGLKYEATFTNNGLWIQTERDIKKEALPKNVLDSFKVWKNSSKMAPATWKIEDVEEHSTPQHHLLYELEVKQNNMKKLLYFLPDGKLLSSMSD